MGLRNILQGTEPTLRKNSRVVTEFNPRLHKLLDDMRETMLAANGLGLAAPQVGVLRRVFVADAGDGLIEFINPAIIEWWGEQVGNEGCLSVPERQEEVVRPMYVTVEAVGRDGKPFTLKASGLMARCVCHEIDHLDGVLYTDYEGGNAVPSSGEKAR